MKTVEVLHSCAYHTQKDIMSEENLGEFKYPCAYTVKSNGTMTYWYSSTNKKGGFGVPKLIFSTGRISSANYFIDYEGEYGLTQFSTGIIDTTENLPRIYNAMRTTKFKKIMEVCAMGVLGINRGILSTFRKDFWKEFI